MSNIKKKLPRNITLSSIAQFHTFPSTCSSGMFTRILVAMTTFYPSQVTNFFFAIYLLPCHVSRLHTVDGGMIGGRLITGTRLPALFPFLMTYVEVIITVTGWNKQFLFLCLLFESLLMLLASVSTD